MLYSTLPVALFASLVSANICLGGIYAALASDVAGCSAATSFCSSKYPIPHATLVVTAPASTTTTTVATATFTQTAPSVTITITVATAYTTTVIETDLTTTVDSTVLLTSTTTAPLSFTTVYVKKRQLDARALTSSSSVKTTSTSKVTSTSKATSTSKVTSTSKSSSTSSIRTSNATTSSKNAKESVWSSIVSLASSLVGDVCSCLETQITTTVTTTPTSITSVTATSTTSTTPTLSLSVTYTSVIPATTTSTVDVTSTSTTTTTVTTTQTVIDSCPTQVVVNGGFEDGTTTPFMFSNSPNFFNNPGGELDLLDNAAIAHSGTYLASVIETDSSLGGLSFSLSQTVTVCAGAPYTLSFYTSSQANVAGSTQCLLQACVGTVCTSFDPSPGNMPNQLVSVGFPGSTSTTVDVVVYTPEIFPGTGITFCGRQFVRFDDFSLTLVT